MLDQTTLPTGLHGTFAFDGITGPHMICEGECPVSNYYDQMPPVGPRIKRIRENCTTSGHCIIRHVPRTHWGIGYGRSMTSNPLSFTEY